MNQTEILESIRFAINSFLRDLGRLDLSEQSFEVVNYVDNASEHLQQAFDNIDSALEEIEKEN